MMSKLYTSQLVKAPFFFHAFKLIFHSNVLMLELQYLIEIVCLSVKQYAAYRNGVNAASGHCMASKCVTR